MVWSYVGMKVVKWSSFGTTPNDPQDTKVLMLYFALGMSGRQWETACFITTDYSLCHYIALLQDDSMWYTGWRTEGRHEYLFIHILNFLSNFKLLFFYIIPHEISAVAFYLDIQNESRKLRQIYNISLTFQMPVNKCGVQKMAKETQHEFLAPFLSR